MVKISAESGAAHWAPNNKIRAEMMLALNTRSKAHCGEEETSHLPALKINLPQNEYITEIPLVISKALAKEITSHYSRSKHKRSQRKTPSVLADRLNGFGRREEKSEETFQKNCVHIF